MHQCSLTQTIKLFAKAVKPRRRNWVSWKLRTIVKMYDWTLPKENNKGRN
jgi:hypothetical protein